MEVCKACVLLEGLNKGLPKLGVGKTAKSLAAYKALQEEEAKDQNVSAAPSKVAQKTLEF